MTTRRRFTADFKSRVALEASLADHMLYMMIELIGPVEELQTQGKHLATDLTAADTSTMTMTLADRASALLTAIGATESFTRLHFFGTEGWAKRRGATHLENAPRGGEKEVMDFPAFNTLKEQQESFAAAALGTADYRIPRKRHRRCRRGGSDWSIRRERGTN